MVTWSSPGYYATAHGHMIITRVLCYSTWSHDHHQGIMLQHMVTSMLTSKTPCWISRIEISKVPPPRSYTAILWLKWEWRDEGSTVTNVDSICWPHPHLVFSPLQAVSKSTSCGLIDDTHNIQACYLSSILGGLQEKCKTTQIVNSQRLCMLLQFTPKTMQCYGEAHTPPHTRPHTLTCLWESLK